MKVGRRQLLGGGALAAAGALTALSSQGGRAVAQETSPTHAEMGHGTKGHGGGAARATMRKGATVDRRADGFNPTDALRDFELE